MNASFSPYLGASFDLSSAEPALLAEIAEQMCEDARRYSMTLPQRCVNGESG